MKTTFISYAILSKSGIIIFIALSVIQCQKESSSYPVGKEIDISIINDSVYRADSIKLASVFENTWPYRYSQKYDSILSLAQFSKGLAEKCFEYKPDSFAHEMIWLTTGLEGFALANTGKIEEGLPIAAKWLNEYIEKRGADQLATELMVSIGMIYAKMGDYQMAIEYNLRDIGLLPKAFNNQNHPYYGGLNQNVAYLYEQIRDWDKSLEYYWKAYDNWVVTDPDGRTWILYNLCRVFLIKDDKISAERMMERIKIVAYESKKVHDIYFYYFVAGLVKMAQGNYEEARLMLQKSLAQSNLIPPEDLSSPFYRHLESLQELGNLELKTKNYKRAIDYFKEKLEFFRSKLGNNNPIEYQITHQIGKAYAAYGDYPKAMEWYQDAIHNIDPSISETKTWQNPLPLQTAPQAELLQILAEKASAAYQWYTQQHKKEIGELAAETFETAFALMDRLASGHQYQSSQIAIANWTRSAFEQALAFYKNEYNQTGDQAWANRIINILEKSKYISLQQALRREKSLTSLNVPLSLLEKERKVKTMISYYETKRFEETRDSGQLSASRLVYLEDRLESLRQSRDSIEEVFKDNIPEYYRLTRQTSHSSLTAIQKKLSTSSDALLEFFAGDSTIYAILITPTNFNIHAQKIDSSFYNLLESVSSLLINKSTPNNLKKENEFTTFIASARILYRQLVDSVIPPNKDIQNLIIIPDGPLGNLPFHVLLEQDPDPEVLATENWRDLSYLLKTKYIHYEYSTALLFNNPTRQRHKQFYAGFAPTFSGQPIAARGVDSAVLFRAFPVWRGGAIPDLKNNRPEVRAVADLTGGQSFLANAATEQTFKQYAPDCGVVHLATHACTDDIDPLYSQILFAQTPGDTAEDGSLHAYELYNMRLDADLAVLSACQTGAGKVQRGEGIMSLSRAFKYAGCPNIVMSLWNADDAVSREIMVRFFINLKAGIGKTKALCQAQRDFLNDATLEEAHPSRWATFVMVGDDAPVTFSSGKWLIALVTLGMAGLILYFFFFRQRV